jgi:hypothetical protein
VTKTAVPSLTRTEVAKVVACATRAPSIHNSQPWTFSYDDPTFTIRADHSRQLHAADPYGRQLTISCGAALYGLRLGLRGLDRHGDVSLLPDGKGSDVIARVRVRPSSPSTSAERKLLSAVSRRHTHRAAFDSSLLPARLLAEVVDAAAAEGAALRLVGGSVHRRRIAALLTAADGVQHHDSLLQREIAAWTPPPGSDRRDGIPAMAYSAGSTGPHGLVARNFDLRRGWGGQAVPADEEHVALGVLWTTGDSAIEWVRAGQALQHLLLVAASGWVFASFYTQPIEVPELRPLLRDGLDLVTGFPQLLLRLGHAPTAQTTPRRALEDVLRTNDR